VTGRLDRRVQTHLSALLEQVERGAEITITKHGREVAASCRWSG
jgi:antitoxin (DNA-binding transcriptional repressor) of toxin-antitoxin stability system